MKRGRQQQHGLIRSNILPSKINSSSSSSSRAFNEFDSRSDSRALINQFDVRPTTVGSLPKTKPPTKPKNQSVFFGNYGTKTKWTACHVFPTAKSKDKIKGTQKLRSKDVGINHKLVSCCVVDKSQGLNYRGVSATAVLGQLSSDYLDDDYNDDDDHVYDVDDGHVYDYGHDQVYNDYDDHVNDVYDDDDFPVLTDELTIHHVVREEGDGRIDDDDDDEDEDDESDDHMSFCDVGFVIDQVDGDGDDEDWCLVGEL